MHDVARAKRISMRNYSTDNAKTINATNSKFFFFLSVCFLFLRLPFSCLKS